MMKNFKGTRMELEGKEGRLLDLNNTIVSLFGTNSDDDLYMDLALFVDNGYEWSYCVGEDEYINVTFEPVEDVELNEDNQFEAEFKIKLIELL